MCTRCTCFFFHHHMLMKYYFVYMNIHMIERNQKRINYIQTVHYVYLLLSRRRECYIYLRIFPTLLHCQFSVRGFFVKHRVVFSRVGHLCEMDIKCGDRIDKKKKMNEMCIFICYLFFGTTSAITKKKRVFDGQFFNTTKTKKI